MTEFTIYDDAEVPNTPERREAMRSLMAMYDRLNQLSGWEPIVVTDELWSDYLDERTVRVWTSHMEGDVEE